MSTEIIIYGAGWSVEPRDPQFVGCRNFAGKVPYWWYEMLRDNAGENHAN